MKRFVVEVLTVLAGFVAVGLFLAVVIVLTGLVNA